MKENKHLNNSQEPNIGLKLTNPLAAKSFFVIIDFIFYGSRINHPITGMLLDSTSCDLHISYANSIM